MAVAVEINKGRVPVYIHTPEVESEAIDQLVNISQLEIVHDRVVAMPDVHAGIGATVGSVIPTKGAIVPAAVGVDIGCGMIAVLTSLVAKDLPLSLRGVRAAIEARIPVGFAMHGQVDAPRREASKLMAGRLNQMLRKHPKVIRNDKRLTWTDQLGTLGGGNHFIELCLDEQDRVWLMLHSGSRGIGNMIGTYFINLAREEMQRLDVHLPDKDLAYLTEGTEHFADYRDAVLWAQDYAMENRRQMLRLAIEGLASCAEIPPFALLDEAVNCFSGETVVMTYEGNRRIKELSGGIHKLLTEGGKWVDAPIKSFGKQKLMKLTLSRCGVVKVIYATPGHRWIVTPLQRAFTLEKTTNELSPGDRLATVFPLRAEVLATDPEGVARGFVFGDGNISSKNRSRANFCGKKDAHLLDVFTSNGYGLSPRKYTALTVINGLPADWKTELPLLGSAASYLYGWLSGYFAADGDVDKSGRPSLWSSKRSNLEFVRDLCTRIGIGTYGIRETKRKGYGADAAPMYLLGLMRKDLCKEFFHIPSHKERFAATVDKISERRSWNVIAVEPTDRFEEVYCAEVEGTHSFALEDNLLTRNCHHNYVAHEHHFGADVWVTRKGAIRAGRDELGIIPGSMGTRSYIVRGLGNADALCSCSHGAGRRMSRGKAKKLFTEQDVAVQTAGVECRKDAGIIDELPGAYKDIDTVMEHQKDLVVPVHTLKQVLCIKG